MRVRLAGFADVPWLLHELRAFASAYPVQSARFPVVGSDAHAEALVGHLIRTQYVAVAEREDGQLVGLVAGVLQPHPFNPDLTIAAELWWWVTPPARGSRAGLLLLADLERWAAEADAPLVLTTEATTAVTDRHLLRRGYVPVERQWLRVPVAPTQAVA